MAGAFLVGEFQHGVVARAHRPGKASEQVLTVNAEWPFFSLMVFSTLPCLAIFIPSVILTDSLSWL